jgi:hypothetical protein
MEPAAKPTGQCRRLAVLLAVMVAAFPLACAVGHPGGVDGGTTDLGIPGVDQPYYPPPPPPPPPADVSGGQDLPVNQGDLPASATPDAPFDGPAGMTPDMVAPPADLPPIDASGPACQIDFDCRNETFRTFCNLQINRCVECRTDGDCMNAQASFPYCDPVLFSCGNCHRGVDGDCANAQGGKLCIYDDTVMGSTYYRCGCSSDADCPSGKTCSGAICTG